MFVLAYLVKLSFLYSRNTVSQRFDDTSRAALWKDSNSLVIVAQEEKMKVIHREACPPQQRTFLVRRSSASKFY